MADDGYIRLTYKAFCELRFQPYMVWDDDELLDELLREGLQISRAGYCEWTTPAGLHDIRPGRAISLGWAWMESAQRQFLLVHHGIQTNVMLVADDWSDLGTSATHQRLSSWLGMQAWVEPVMESLAHEEPANRIISSLDWGHA